MADTSQLTQGIIQLLGLQALPTEKQVEIIEKATDMVQRRIMLHILDSLPEEKKADAMRVLGSGTEEEKITLMQSVGNLQDIMNEEIEKAKSELLELVNALDLPPPPSENQ